MDIQISNYFLRKMHSSSLLDEGASGVPTRVACTATGKKIVRPRWKWGAGPADKEYSSGEGAKCGDCGAAPGSYHRGGCDVEHCPVCGGQVGSGDKHALLP